MNVAVAEAKYDDWCVRWRGQCRSWRGTWCGRIKPIDEAAFARRCLNAAQDGKLAAERR